MRELISLLAASGVRQLISREPNLTEVFIGLYEGEEP
jgi:hypothetical protein